MQVLKDKLIVLCVTGGIAAYKACDIINLLKKEGARVKVLMTKNAEQFITPLTLETLSGEKVITNMFDRPDYMEVEHISLAQEADAFVVAPATANMCGKLAHGIADDMISTTILATRKPVFIAPAMNTQMWVNTVVQENIERLKSLPEIFIISPDIGHLACGTTGAGKLARPIDIVHRIKNLFELREPND